MAYIIFGYAIVPFYHFCTPIIFSSMGILVQLSTPAPNTITQSLTATGTIQWAAGSLFYLPEGLLVEAVFVSEGEAVQEGDKIAALRREDVEQKLRSLQAELAQKQTEYARLTKPVAADSYDLEKASRPCRPPTRQRRTARQPGRRKKRTPAANGMPCSAN